VNATPPLRPRVGGRDFKPAGRGGGSLLDRYQQFFFGLAIGIGVAFVVYVTDARQRERPAPQSQPQPRAAKQNAEPEAEQPVAQYDFYNMLPKFEVVVPEKERDVRTDTPTAPVARPGVYVLQAGSYRNQPDAERVRAQLAKQGIEATVQRVQVDTDVWHRVRIGPTSDLTRLNAMRAALRKADVDTIVVRVGD
jgi:cell division protein FtsN